MVTFDKDKLLKQLQALKLFPNNKEVKALRKRISVQLERLERKLIPETKQDLKAVANVKRSGKLRRYHNYIRQIRNNFPNFSYSEIRKQLTKRKQGLESDVPDAVWQNPSP